jgi:hypothetical protein
MRIIETRTAVWAIVDSIAEPERPKGKRPLNWILAAGTAHGPGQAEPANAHPYKPGNRKPTQRTMSVICCEQQRAEETYNRNPARYVPGPPALQQVLADGHVA